VPKLPDRVATARPAAVSDSAIDGYLAEIERVSSRDDAVGVACRACLSTARGAAFLALRQGVFRGWDGVGEDITSASIRSLWVPASNPSVLSEVLHSERIFRGNYGQTAADHLLRAALGSHGREVLVVPVRVASRVVGVLCANDPALDTSAVERVAEALGKAFERLIVSRRSGA
jgi:GAF domain-containing protein